MKDKNVIILSRKALLSLIGAWFLLFVLVAFSFQYTNYVDRNSNRVWCGVIKLFNNTYEKEPPATEAGKILQHEFLRINEKFC